MSIWSTCTGVVHFNQNSRFSVRKAIEAIHDDVTYKGNVEHKNGIEITTFEIAICFDGIEAAKIIESFVRTLRENPHYKYSEIEANIRFT